MKQAFIAALAALTLTAAATAAVAPTPTTVAATLTKYLNVQNHARHPGETLTTKIGVSGCTATRFPVATGQVAPVGTTFFCWAQVTTPTGVSLGLGLRTGWEIAVSGSHYTYLPILAACAPPHFCDPALQNAGGPLTND